MNGSAIPDSMLAAVYHGRGDVRTEEIPVPEPGPGEVLIRVAFSGVCGSDVTEYTAGPLLFHIGSEPHPISGHSGPLVFGHEFAGYVVARGEGATIPIGTLVACGAGISCGQCRQCRRGKSNLCEEYYTLGFHRNGGLAEYCAAPADACVDADALGVGPGLAGISQPMAIAVHSFHRGDPDAGDEVAVIGAGGIGAFLTYTAVEAAAEVTVLDVNPERLELARRLGAHHLLDAGELTPEEALAKYFDCTYEVSGQPSALEMARRFATRGDKLVVVGAQAPSTGVDCRAITLDELNVVGTSAHAIEVDLPEALRVLASRDGGWDDVAPTAFPLADVVSEGLAGGGGRVKTVFAPWARAAMPMSEADAKAREIPTHTSS
ncbi:MAG: (R,R)-butanediol dehydrogenase / meso-butanediol dehydrogenase / diacetyl reductase [Solirubrobacterales bacterium]|nr:(R,R)-butanediol dehydrogenase / meso-butanediol dehydrogenase / diacetyl reductase [Solirubrobacterales bacterium]